VDKRIEVELKEYLGTAKAYWQGNSLRIALPNEIVDKYGIVRKGKSIFGGFEEKEKKFLFFDTDKGIMIKVLDKEAEKKLLGVFGALDLTQLKDEDFKILFG